MYERTCARQFENESLYSIEQFISAMYMIANMLSLPDGEQTRASMFAKGTLVAATGATKQRKVSLPAWLLPLVDVIDKEIKVGWTHTSRPYTSIMCLSLTYWHSFQLGSPA